MISTAHLAEHHKYWFLQTPFSWKCSFQNFCEIAGKCVNTNSHHQLTCEILQNDPDMSCPLSYAPYLSQNIEIVKCVCDNISN
jgi:hypothetical protein